LVSRPTNLLVSADFTNGAKGLGGRVGFGSSIAFGGVGASVRNYDNSGGTGFGIGVDGGLSLVGGPTKNILFCPIASLSYGKPPSQFNYSTTEGSVGLAAGATLKTSPGLDVVPFGSLSAVFDRYSFDNNASTHGSSSDNYALLTLGLGFQLAQGIMIRPTFASALGRTGSDPIYSIGIAFPLGHR
ncbi:MAG: hypothetical protein ABIT38_05210, partial [Gemmatimonadaceae bacterium]